MTAGRAQEPTGPSIAPETALVKLKLTIAYDGGRFQGWQTQKTGIGVQQHVERVLRQLFPGATGAHGSSRTDTGVHALGLAAHVEIPAGEWKMTPRKFVLAMNAFLPEDIRIMAATIAEPDFHARFDAVGKQYRYSVWNHAAMNPLLRAQAWHVPTELDDEAMRAAAAVFVGKHDFQSFSANPGYGKGKTVRTVTHCDLKRNGPLLTFTIEGDGFLYKMCRGIVGTIVQVGRGKISAADVKPMFASRDRRVAGVTAPAQGLVLWKVYY